MFRNVSKHICNTLYDSPALFFRRQEQRPLFCAIGALCFSGPKNKGARSDAFLTNQSISEWIDLIQRTLSAASAPSLRGGEVREIRKLHLGGSAVCSKLYDARGRGVFLSSYLPTEPVLLPANFNFGKCSAMFPSTYVTLCTIRQLCFSVVKNKGSFFASLERFVLAALKQRHEI